MPSSSFPGATKNLLKEYFLYAVLVILICALIFKNDGGAALGIVVAVCLIIVAIGPENIASASFGPKGFEWQRVKEETDRNSDLIAKFIFLSMPINTYNNLKKIASGDFGRFRMPDGMRQQLRYLRDNGFIVVKGTVGDLPADGEQLSKYVDATESGRDFIQVRERLQSTERSPPGSSS